MTNSIQQQSQSQVQPQKQQSEQQAKNRVRTILVHGYSCGIEFWKFLPAKPNGGFNGYTKYLKSGECVLFYWSRVISKLGFWEAANPLKIREAYKIEQSWASSPEAARSLESFFCEKFGILKTDGSYSFENHTSNYTFDNTLQNSAEYFSGVNQAQNLNNQDPNNQSSNNQSSSSKNLEKTTDFSISKPTDFKSINPKTQNSISKKANKKYDKKIVAHSTGCRLVLNWLKKSSSLEEFLKNQTLEIDLFNPEFEIDRCLEDDFDGLEDYKNLKKKVLKKKITKTIASKESKSQSKKEKVSDIKSMVESPSQNKNQNSASFLIQMIDQGRLKINLHYCPWDQTLWLSPMYNYYFPAGIFGSKSRFFENKISPLWQWNLNFHVASINSPKVAKKIMNDI